MPGDDPLRLVALDAEDLAVLSAHVQDAVVKVGEMTWLAAEKRFVLMMNRFAWEAGARRARLKREYQRRRCCLHFDRIEAVRSAGIDRSAEESLLKLLAIRFEPREAPSGIVLIDFAGGATIHLSAECVEAQLADLGSAWTTPHVPRHAAG
jgi:hypothetical protein